MANQKRGRLEGFDLRFDGALPVFQFIRALNKTYEGTITVGISPVTIDFRGDQGWNSLQGWITNDGPGDLIVSFTRDGTIYGDSWTMFIGENTNLMGFDIAKLKLTHTGTDTSYRIFLI